MKKPFTTEHQQAKLLFKLLSHEQFQVPHDDHNERIFNRTLDHFFIENKSEDSIFYDISDVYLLRVLANLITVNPVFIRLLCTTLLARKAIISKVFNRFFSLDNQLVTKEVLWLAGIIYNSPWHEVTNYLQTDNFPLNLKIKRSSVPNA